MSNAHIFRDIRDKKAEADILYEDEEVLVFRDIQPKAPTHLLFIPRYEVRSIIDIADTTEHIPGMLILKAKQFTEEHAIPGYKLVFHVGKEGGQIIDYLHLHLLADTEV